MRKKIFYIGILIFAIAAVLFFVSGALYSNALARVLTTTNLTVSSGGFSFAAVQTGNSSLVAVYAVASNRTNMYLFNASAFNAWRNYISGAHLQSGLAYAQALGTPGTSFIDSNTLSSQFILTTNQSELGANSSVIGLSQFNGTAYLVIDNTNGSNSYNTSLKGVVSYFKMTSANLDIYNKIAITELAIIVLGIAGIITTIYGAIKKAPDSAAVTAAKGSAEEPVSKEYIDSLYKNVGKGRKKSG